MTCIMYLYCNVILSHQAKFDANQSEGVVKMQSIRTNGSEQTVQTEIRLLLKDFFHSIFVRCRNFFELLCYLRYR